MSNIINSVARALDVLLYIKSQEEPVGISTISKDMDIYKSTVFRILATLESKKFVQQDPKSGKYALGVALFSMGNKIDLYDVFKPFAKALCEEFGETVNVSVLNISKSGVPQSVVVVKEEKSDNVLSVSPKIGTSMDCYCSSVGKSLLAFSKDVPEEALGLYDFIQFTSKTITDQDALKEQLETIRRNGYAVDDEEQEVGLTCIGAPIMKDGNAIAAMSVSGPTSRIQRHDMDMLAKRLIEVAGEISELI